MDNTPQTPEELYDEHLSPLMAQIIAVAKEHKIAFHASFSLSNDPDDDFRCTSHQTDNETHPQFRADYDPFSRGARQDSNPLMVTVRDGDGRVKEMHAYVR